MFSRLFALIMLLLISYCVLIFVAPDFTDTYGNREFNENARMLKRSLELDRTMSGSSTLLDEASNIAKPYIDSSRKIIDETKSTIDTVQTTVLEKTEQVKAATEATKNAIDAAKDAKNKIDSLTQFWTGQ